MLRSRFLRCAVASAAALAISLTVSPATPAVAQARPSAPASFPGFASFHHVKIPGANGIKLDAATWIHRDGTPRPAIVMPGPWTQFGWRTYTVMASKYALAGYNVLAYSARGFGSSEGGAEGGGPLDVQDGSKALDHLIAQAPGRTTKVGFTGLSYGSGLSQLIAAQDPRVDAVAALSTWGDLGEAFYENRTRHLASVRALQTVKGNARLSARTQRMFSDLLANRNIPQALEWAKQRSPKTYLKQLNKRRVPVFYGQAWHETLFPSNQSLKTFNRLTGPKRIDVSIGDHAGPEMTGMAGLPNHVAKDAKRWFDRFLKGERNGIDTEGQVNSQVMWKYWPWVRETRPNWGAFTERTERLNLTGPGGGRADGALSSAALRPAAPSTGWRMPFTSGTDTTASVGGNIVFVAGYKEMVGLPKTYRTDTISRKHAAVWTSAPMEATTRLRGTPKLRLTYTATTAQSTIIAHLFDVDAHGKAHIITHAPFTSPGGRAGRPVTADISLQAAAYDVPTGHRLMLVVDTKDAFYGDANGAGGQITVTSPKGRPSYLDVPTG
ncbi:CocE/NonD family hydrolase [Streptomyces halobius]|uniref:CocE/NonD family hydrolase n=1 Tax=Streptomyces halobius TaxID=2879846 RepID=A0ABY4MCT8_9ACTN|nr:CocE/NonD family hydrolase [Streptomyces halobius]UQA94589.1 CocE/NonD family hydrolase [Streptomyces halobius]